MTLTAFLVLLPMLLGMVGIRSPGDNQQVRSVVIEDQLVIRVPVRPPPPQLEWTERKGPKCLAPATIRGAFLSGNDHVDFLLAGHRLLRAELAEDCPALDFYEGFYLTSSDDRICAKRDAIRSRMGATCRIERFRELVNKARH